MVALRAADAEADRRAFAAAGIGGLPRFDFARQGRRPDGGAVEVAFSLAFAKSPALPSAGFFVCQQRFPENFWSRAAQVHPNGALGVAGVTLVCDEPAERPPSSPPSSMRPVQAIDGGVAFAADGATIECLTPARFAARYGGKPAAGGLAAARIAVADLDACNRRLAASGVPTRDHQGSTIVDAASAMGVTLAFLIPVKANSPARRPASAARQAVRLVVALRPARRLSCARTFRPPPSRTGRRP